MNTPVFFSGGSAIASLSRYFARNNIRTSHLITTFDNGGSSAELRKVFAMPAVGDIRNRLLALASPNCPAAVTRLLRLRLSKTLPQAILERQFEKLLSPANPNWRKMPQETASLLAEALYHFYRAKPPSFNFANASIGNLALAGFYLAHGGDLPQAIAPMAMLLAIRGEVAAITCSHLQLGAVLADGSILVGQDKFKNLPAPVRKIFLTVHEPGHPQKKEDIISCKAPISSHARELISRAASICYPPGSFYSSLLANLKIEGVAENIAQKSCPKIMIPNSGRDPEALGLGVAAQVKILLATLKEAWPTSTATFLDFVVVDSRNGKYQGDLKKDLRELAEMGIAIVDEPIVAAHNPACHLPRPLARLLLQLTGRNE